MTKADKIQTLIHRLSGSTDSMSHVCEELGLSDLDDEVTSAVDQEIFNCSDCNWWCEQSEESSEFIEHDEWICSQCAMENHGWDGEQ